MLCFCWLTLKFKIFFVNQSTFTFNEKLSAVTINMTITLGHQCFHISLSSILNNNNINRIKIPVHSQSAAHLFKVIGSDIVDRRIHVRLLQTVETSLQSSHEALPQVVHRADELICHSLIQAHHYKFLDLVNARLDLLRCNKLSITCCSDVCS